MAAAPDSGARGPGAGRAYVFSGKNGRRLLTLDAEKAGDGFGGAAGGRSGFIVIGAGGAGPRSNGRLYVYDRLEARPDS